MGFVLFPTLKDVTFVKITAAVCEHSDIYPFTQRCFIFDNSREKDFEKVAIKILPPYLPIGLQKLALAWVKTLCWQIRSWRRTHFIILYETADKLVKFYWRSDGTIDNAKTAEALLRDDTMDDVRKFDLACCYFLQKYIPNLWNKILVNERRNCFFRRMPDRFVFEFWLPWLKSGASAEFLAEFTPTDLSDNYFLLSLVFANLSLRSFVENLPMSKCLDWLRKIAKLKLLNDDLLHFLVSGSLRSQQMIVFCEDAYNVLRCFLYSPFQSLFSDVAQYLWEYLSVEEFFEVIKDICAKIEGRREDFDYLQLLKQFWTKSPLPYKEYLQEKLKNDKLVNYGIIAKHLSKFF